MLSLINLGAGMLACVCISVIISVVGRKIEKTIQFV